MLKILPSPRKNHDEACHWLELMIGLNYGDVYKEITEDFWQKIVPKLNEFKNIDINGPDDIAWFHLRRVANKNEKSISTYSKGRLELLRLRKNIVSEDVMEEIRLMAGQHKDVVCGGWWETNFTGHHNNSFLSFLQKLSKIRVLDRLFIEKNLTKVIGQYHKCPNTKEAYTLMTDYSKPWFKTLQPWLDHMSLNNFEPNLTHEYAHWFAHILTGW